MVRVLRRCRTAVTADPATAFTGIKQADLLVHADVHLRARPTSAAYDDVVIE
jgi:hypothetical protein